jgi:hypothetical protein
MQFSKGTSVAISAVASHLQSNLAGKSTLSTLLQIIRNKMCFDMARAGAQVPDAGRRMADPLKASSIGLDDTVGSIP